MRRLFRPPRIPRHLVDLASRDIDEATALLAARQCGVVSRAQLLAMGADGATVDRRVRRGRLRRVHPGVYAVGHDHLELRGRGMAALLWAGDDAVLSHRTAALLWGLLEADDGPIHVTGRRGGRAPAGIVLHCVRHLPTPTKRRGLPVTTVPRTLLDLGDVEQPRLVRRILGEALYQKRTSVPQLTRELQASPGRRSAAVLRRLLPTASATHSDLERRFVELVVRAGLPRPETNVRVAGFVIDAYWPAWNLVVELDTFHSHGDHLAFEEDRRRDAALRRARCEVLRFTDEQLASEPLNVIGTIYSAASSHQ